MSQSGYLFNNVIPENTNIFETYWRLVRNDFLCVTDKNDICVGVMGGI